MDAQHPVIPGSMRRAGNAQLCAVGVAQRVPLANAPYRAAVRRAQADRHEGATDIEHDVRLQNR